MPSDPISTALPPAPAPAPKTPAPTARGDGVYRILSIDGGGYLGLATAAFIAGIEQVEGPGAFARQFDLFCGASTGAILSLGLASGRTGAELQHLYQSLGPAVFGPSQRRLLRGYVGGARYSNAALRAALVAEFKQRPPGGGAPAPGAPDLTLGDLRARRKYVMATAFNLTTGKPRVFKTDHHPDFGTDDGLRVADVALASGAAPYYLPAVPITNPKRANATELFCDGGVVANHPALLGVVEAAHTLYWPLGSVRVLSLSTPAVPFGEGTAAVGAADRSLYGWGPKLASMFIEAGAAISGQVLRRLIEVLPPEMQPRYDRIEMANPGKHAIDDASRAAQKAHLLEGANLAADGAHKARVRAILA